MLRNHRVITVALFVILSAPLLYFSFVESSLRGVVVFLLLIFWILRSLRRGLLLASLEFFLISMPFAISFVVPQLADRAYVSGVYVNYLAPTLYLQDIAVVLMIFSLIFSTERVEFRNFFKSAHFKIIGIITIFFILHNLYFLQIEVLLNSLRYLLYFILLLFGLYRRDAITEGLSKDRKTFIGILAGLLVVQLVISFKQASGGVGLGLGFLGESQLAAGSVGSSSSEIGGRLFLRGYGTFPHPNLLGGYAAMVVSILLAMNIRKVKIHIDNFFGNNIYTILILLSVSIAILSFSQSAWLVILVNFALYGYWRISNRHLKQEKEIQIPAIALLTEFRPLNERLLLLAASYRYLLDNIFWGVGSGNFVRNFYKYSPTGEAGISLLQPVHNIFALMIVEYGLIFGLFLNLLLIGSMFVKFLASKWKIILLMFASFIFIIGNLDHYLLTLPQGLMMLLVVLFGYFSQDE